MPFINTAVKKVAHSLQVLWPRSRAKIFGSNATGLALPTSDVDLVVSLPPVRKVRSTLMPLSFRLLSLTAEISYNDQM
jgi:DNA polymerase sigma